MSGIPSPLSGIFPIIASSGEWRSPFFSIRVECEHLKAMIEKLPGFAEGYIILTIPRRSDVKLAQVVLKGVGPTEYQLLVRRLAPTEPPSGGQPIPQEPSQGGLRGDGPPKVRKRF